MKLFIPLLSLLLGFAVTSPAYSQSDIELHVLKPVGFLAPGSTENILLEIVNPSDSGITIERISGGGRSGRQPVIGTLIQSPDLMRRMQSMRNSSACPATLSSYCLVSGELPIRPGESATVIYLEIIAPEDIPHGSEIGYSSMSLKFALDNGEDNARYYADKDLIRLFTADGQGDSSIFNGIDIDSPAAGRFNPELVAEFTYPTEIMAGEPFDLSTTISNRSADTLYFHSLQGRGGASGMRGSGDHANSYRFIGCEEDCLLDGEIQLKPGDSFSYRLGTYYYENEDFFDGELRLTGLTLHVSDQNERSNMIAIASDELLINISSSADSERLYGRRGSQALPLETRDLNAAGDGLVIYDPNTSLEWLRLTATSGYDAEQIVNELVSGGLFENFVLASSSQVEQLVLNHVNANGGDLREYALYSMADSDQFDIWRDFMRMMGTIPSRNSSWGAIGVVSDPVSNNYASGREYYSTIEVQVPAPPPDGQMLMMFSGSTGLTKSVSDLYTSLYEYVGFWLVRGV